MGATPIAWLTADEVAELAKCSRETVIRAIHSKAIPNARLTGGAWIIPTREGTRWAEKYVPYQGLMKGKS